MFFIYYNTILPQEQVFSFLSTKIFWVFMGFMGYLWAFMLKSTIHLTTWRGRRILVIYHVKHQIHTSLQNSIHIEEKYPDLWNPLYAPAHCVLYKMQHGNWHKHKCIKRKQSSFCTLFTIHLINSWVKYTPKSTENQKERNIKKSFFYNTTISGI